MLAELEEIITYKQYADQPDRQATIRKTWMKRYIYLNSYVVQQLDEICLLGWKNSYW